MPDRGFLVDRGFGFSTLNLLTHCLLASKASGKKSALDLIEDPLYVTRHFSCCFQDALSFYPTCDYSRCGCGSLHSSYLEFIELLGHLYPRFIIFGKISVIISSSILSDAFSFLML